MTKHPKVSLNYSLIWKIKLTKTSTNRTKWCKICHPQLWSQVFKTCHQQLSSSACQQQLRWSQVSKTCHQQLWSHQTQLHLKTTISTSVISNPYFGSDKNDSHQLMRVTVNWNPQTTLLTEPHMNDANPNRSVHALVHPTNQLTRFLLPSYTVSIRFYRLHQQCRTQFQQHC